MKKTKIFLVIAILFCTFANVMGQSNSKDVTKFLGIDVDGTKSAMIQKLKAKGFTYNAQYECLEGEFNGSNVNIYIHTNNNKVDRIMVCDVNSHDVGEIKIRFNRLCSQFENNKKYISIGNQQIEEKEDISYEMLVHSKKYDAIFYQRPTDTGITDDDIAIETIQKKVVWFRIAEHYGKYYIAMFYDNEYNMSNGEDL